MPPSSRPFPTVPYLTQPVPQVGGSLLHATVACNPVRLSNTVQPLWAAQGKAPQGKEQSWVQVHLSYATRPLPISSQSVQWSSQPCAGPVTAQSTPGQVPKCTGALPPWLAAARGWAWPPRAGLLSRVSFMPSVDGSHHGKAPSHSGHSTFYWGRSGGLRSPAPNLLPFQPGPALGHGSPGPGALTGCSPAPGPTRPQHGDPHLPQCPHVTSQDTSEGGLCSGGQGPARVGRVAAPRPLLTCGLPSGTVLKPLPCSCPLGAILQASHSLR